MSTEPTNKQPDESADRSLPLVLANGASFLPSGGLLDDGDMADPYCLFLYEAGFDLIDRAEKLAGAKRPKWARVWYAPIALDLLDQARPLLDEARRREGKEPMPICTLSDSTKRKIITAQWICGIGNAFMGFVALDEGNWIGVGASAFALVLTACWRIRRKTYSVDCSTPWPTVKEN